MKHKHNKLKEEINEIVKIALFYDESSYTLLVNRLYPLFQKHLEEKIQRVREIRKKYDGIETFNYQGPAPLSEYAEHQDRGYRSALDDVLKILEEGKE